MGISVVLAGGRGSRLGGAKAGVLLAGRPLIEHVLEAVRAGGLEPMVVAKRDSALPPLDCRVVFEPARPQHPLCGIVAGLRAAGEPAVVVCACDMPYLNGELLAWLSRLQTPLAVASAGGWIQPLLGRYSASLLDQLEAQLAAQAPMRAVARVLGAQVLGEAELEPFGDPARLCLSINTPEELAAAGG